MKSILDDSKVGYMLNVHHSDACVIDVLCSSLLYGSTDAFGLLINMC